MGSGLLGLVLIWLCLISTNVFADEDVDKARAFVAEGRAEEAYGLLRSKEFERAGDTDFDYVLGVSALQSGRPAIALLAFERVLALNASHAGAQLDMGRAYYALGDMDRAEQAFAVVRELGAPPAALATIRNYEKAIEARRDPTKLRLTGYAEASWGGDSNVNQATSSSSIAIPAFGGTYSLGTNSQARRDEYGAITVGGEAQLGIADGTNLYAAADAQVRDYRKLNPYDNSMLDARAGVAHTTGKDYYRFGLGYNDYRMESDRYRGVATAIGEWRHALDPNTATSLAVQYNEIRYVQSNSRGNDVNVVLVAGGLTRVLGGPQRTTVDAGVFAGSEREERERTDGNRWLGGLRAGVRAELLDDLDVFGNVAAQLGLYSRYNSLFLVRRREAQFDLGLGMNWRFAPLWSLRPSMAVSRVDSNLPIYDTLRYDVSLNLRRDFR